MIKRWWKLKEVVQNLTKSAILDIDGLTKPQHRKLQSWNFNVSEWETLEMLKKNLPPFFSATQLLSGIKYPTLPLNQYVYKNLKYFLSKNLILNPKSVQNFVKEH